MDSFVIDIEQDDRGLTIVVEAALRTEHPQFYWPPKDGEANSYARLIIHLQGEVEWHDGPRPKPASDATGERDFGDLAGWWTDDDGTEHLDGEWGRVVVRSPSQTIETPPPAT